MEQHQCIHYENHSRVSVVDIQTEKYKYATELRKMNRAKVFCCTTGS